MAEEPTTDTDVDTASANTTEPELTADEVRDKLRAEIEHAKKLRARAQIAEAERDKLAGRAISQEAVEEYERLKAEAAEREEAKAKDERERLEKQGEWEALREKDDQTHKKAMAQKDKAHGEELGKKDEEITRLAGIVAKLGAENPLQAALSAAKVQDISAAVFYIQNSPQSKYHVVSGLDADGQPVPKVIDKDGDEVVDPDSDGKMMTVDGLVSHFVASDFGQRFLAPSGDTGSGAVRGVKRHHDGLTQRKLIADPKKHFEFVQQHGPEAFSKLPPG